VCKIDGRPSQAFDLEEMRRDTKCLSGAGGETRYVSMMSIDAVVGTLSVRKRHVVLHTRELLSEE